MSSEKILVVDDEPSIREIVTLYLKRSGYEVITAADGQVAVDVLARQTFDLVVLDLMLPRVDGLEITRRLRATSQTPIIMLTARSEEIDRILGLEMGADDYVTKPFSPQELVSRVRAVLRRSQRAQQLTLDTGERPLVYDDLRIDPQKRLVEASGKEIMLTAREFDLLWLLARHPRQVFNRDQLLDLVWGVTEYIDASTITVHVRRLREKIEADPANPRHIVTVWGVGYKFEP